jgi:predicted GIY-YIG superfamily endonuclease
MYNLYYLKSTLDDKIYVGITNNPDRRYYEHIHYTVEKNHYNGNWIRKTLKNGGEIKMEVVLSNLTKKAAIQLEIRLIEMLKKLTPKYITNTAQGGYGFNHKGIPHSEEHKKALEKAQPHKVRIPKDILYDLYVNKKLSKKKIGKIYNCGPTTIDRRLIEYGIQARTTINYKASYKLDKEEILNLYLNEKLSMLEIANINNIGINGIRTFMNREGIKIDSNRKTPKKPNMEVLKQLKELYNSGIKQKEIAKIMNFCEGHISYLLNRYIRNQDKLTENNQI